jgi:hypothetical protein
MRIHRPAALCVALLAGMVLASAGRAGPINVILDTQSYSGTSFALYFQFSGADGESVTISNFATDGALDDKSIFTTGSVSASSLPSNVMLSVDSSIFPSSEYFESIELKDYVSFSFDVTSTNTGVGPLFAFSLVDPTTYVPPLDESGQAIFGDPMTGVLVKYDAGFDPPLFLFTTDQISVREAANVVTEPDVLALLAAALLVVCCRRTHFARLRSCS